MLPRKGRGEYPLRECIAQYIRYLRRMVDGKTSKSQLSEEKLLTARLERKRKELDLARHEGSLIHVDDHVKAMAEAFDLVRSNIRNLPGSLAPRLTGLEDARDVQAILVREVDDALRAIVKDAQDRMEEPVGLPDDLPGRRQLEKAGVTDLVDILAVEDFTIYPGIGQATAKKLRAWLEEKR